MQNKPYTLLLLGLVTIFSVCCKSKQSSPPKTPTTAMTTDALSLKQEIYTQIQEGNTAEAITLLKKVKPQESELLEQRFDRVKNDFTNGLVEFDNYIITLMRIHYSVLEYTPGKATTPVKSPVSSSQLNELLEAGELANALKLMLSSNEIDATLLLSRLNLGQKYHATGLLTNEQFDKIKLMTKLAITEMAK